MKHEPRVVAELGRPETPEETAARKAESSRNYRQRKTVNNLIYSLLVTVGMAFVIVLLVPRGDAPLDRTVDYSQVVAQAQIGIDEPLMNPVLGNDWRANAAEIRTGAGDVKSWYIGLLTPEDQYIGLTQGIDANPTWLSELLMRQSATSTTTIGGVTWDVYTNTLPAESRGNFTNALVTVAGDSTIALVGTASDAELAELATTLGPDIQTLQNGD